MKIKILFFGLMFSTGFVQCMDDLVKYSKESGALHHDSVEEDSEAIDYDSNNPYMALINLNDAGDIQRLYRTVFDDLVRLRKGRVKTSLSDLDDIIIYDVRTEREAREILRYKTDLLNGKKGAICSVFRSVGIKCFLGNGIAGLFNRVNDLYLDNYFYDTDSNDMLSVNLYVGKYARWLFHEVDEINRFYAKRLSEQCVCRKRYSV